jgi:PII-like signaling protein
MKKGSSALVLRIYVSSTDRCDEGLVYETLVFKAKKAGLAGANVSKGILGFGASSVIHSYKFWEISEKLPVTIEFVDDEEKIVAFYQSIEPLLETMKYGCLAITEKVAVMQYKPGKKRS